MKNKRTPDIRFVGFTGDWEQRRLSEVSERVRGNDGRMDLPTLTMSASAGWLDQRERFSGNIAGNEQKNYTLLSVGELSYNHGNSKLAKYGVVFKLRTFKEALVPRVYHSFKTTEDANADFIEYMFETKLPDRELGKLVSSGARMDGLLNINYDDFMGIKIKLPTVQEQEKIGVFLRGLDNHITLHQQELTTLKQTKQGFLQKMFPKEGKSVPEVRFPGFTGDWEQCKLGELVGIRSGWSPSDFVETEESNGELYVKVDDLNYSIREQLDSKMKVKFYNRYPMMKKGSIIFPKRGAAIMTNKVRVLGSDGYMDTNMMALEPNKVDGNFLYTFINKTGLFKIADTSTIPQINNKHIEPYKIFLPVEQEQTKIGNFFKQLDDTIALHQRELDALKETKKAFLQKMFV
ncbi:restriction endonuclease subunit S [Bacillus cereus]